LPASIGVFCHGHSRPRPCGFFPERPITGTRSPPGALGFLPNLPTGSGHRITLAPHGLAAPLSPGHAPVLFQFSEYSRPRPGIPQVTNSYMYYLSGGTPPCLVPVRIPGATVEITGSMPPSIIMGLRSRPREQPSAPGRAKFRMNPRHSFGGSSPRSRPPLPALAWLEISNTYMC
jgi:hypothetical protein